MAGAPLETHNGPIEPLVRAPISFCWLAEHAGGKEEDGSGARKLFRLRQFWLQVMRKAAHTKLVKAFRSSTATFPPFGA